jgi:hypothetical protein
MPPTCDFVGALAVPGKSFKEIEKTVRNIYSDKALKKTELYDIIRQVKEGKPADQRLFNGKKKVKHPTFVADIAAEVTSNRHATVRKLAQNHAMSTKTIHVTLHKDLNLSKK